MLSERPLPRKQTVPILALRNSVLFPMSVVPVNVGRPRSIRLVEQLVEPGDALVGVVSQRDAEKDEPDFDDLYEVGTLARIVKVIRLGTANFSVVLNGVARFRILAPGTLEPFMKAEVERLVDTGKNDPDLPVIGQELRDATRELLGLLSDLPRETASILDNVREPGALADLIASNSPDEHATIPLRQKVLEAVHLPERVQAVLAMVRHQLQVLKARSAISLDELGKSQRDQVLRQQMRHIRDELGDAGDDEEIEALRERIDRAGMPEEAERAARKQVRRLAGIPSQSAEHQVARTYLDWLVDLPWSRSSPDRVDVAEVRRCLEEDHYGLATVKRRIVEFSAVRKLRRNNKGPILLFVGPPGVGKTSLGRSIARAMGRKYARIALGGVRDEAEIRGHRRTYVGALPGRIIQAMKRVGTNNPVLVLDEVDKLGADVRGDPAAALLEVLDPEQNLAFVDHYIDLPFDLSRVLFLATANYFHEIPEALRDRLETIEVPGYTRTEKLGIALEFLIPKQLREHGLSEDQLKFEREGVELLIDHYTREAGVRGLEREIAALCRGVTVRLAETGDNLCFIADPDLVEEVLGAFKYRPELLERRPAPGVAAGIGVSGTGGDLLFVEATLMPGRGEIRLTGRLGDVFRESAETAVSYVRSRAQRLELPDNWLDRQDLHVHVPRARASFDSAGTGLAIYAAVVSLLRGQPLLETVALCGELTLRGSVLGVRDVKSILLAAHRAGIRRILLPKANASDLGEVPAEILNDLDVRLIHRVSEVLPLVLDPTVSPRPFGTPPDVPDQAIL